MIKQDLLKDTKIVVDCLTAHYTNCITDTLKSNWVLRVESYKQSDEWIKSPKSDWDHHEGRRFNDNERVVDVILGCMRLQINKLLGNEHDGTELSESSFDTYIKTIDENKLNEWIDAALHYSAGCDHWYTFEKDWG